MPSVPLSEQSFWFHWFLFWKRETPLQILLPKHLADLTPQVILYPICRRKKLWLSAVSPAVSASVWQAISNSLASSIQPSEKPALSLPVILWSSLSSDCSLAKDGFSIGKGDLLVLVCAFLFSLHILVIDYFSPKVDGVKLSCIQFLTCGVLSGIPALLLEHPELSSILAAWQPILYAGVMSCGVAYTLQIIGQKNMNPTVASLILSLESCISVLAGWIILRQQLSTKEILGCVIMFAAIILAQLPQKQTE